MFRNITYLSDTSGTGVWRRIWPINQIDCIAALVGTTSTYMQTPILDLNFYKGMTSITVLRWISPLLRELFCKFLKPISDANSGWLIYEIDDNMSDEYIPKYNRGRKAFEGEEILNNIRQMLNTADFVTVTTDYIKQFYHEHYGVPLENIIAIPNFLPKYLFGDKFDPERKLKQFRSNKARPRIGIVSSLSHYNIDNVRVDKNNLACRLEKTSDGTEHWINEKGEVVPEAETSRITDDFDDIADVIRKTVKDFLWVCFGYCPPLIKDLADAKKIEIIGGVPIYNYPSVFHNLNLLAVIAPVKKTKFNFCKSFIKYMECAALGVPLFATRCEPYSRVMPDDLLFDSLDELETKLRKLKFLSPTSYEGIINKQWKWLNSLQKEGDFNVRGFFLEDNLLIWIDIFKLRQKSLHISMSSFILQYNTKKLNELKNLIAKSESGEATITL